MKKQRSSVPVKPLIAALILIVLGVATFYLIQATATPDQMAKNVLLSALPFILVFIAIILLFASLIIFTSARLGHTIAFMPHRIVEFIAMAGIVLGIFSIFQPWVFALYRPGFLTLLFSTLFFILWSHVEPKRLVLHDE